MIALFMRVGRIPVHGVERAWEAARHERLAHVIAPWKGSLLEVGGTFLPMVVALVWGLFGVRVSARRELQAALAAVPPKTPGGSSQCRRCGAPLSFATAALGVRCASCGADNLVAIPPTWAARAQHIDRSLPDQRAGDDARPRQPAPRAPHRAVARAAGRRRDVVHHRDVVGARARRHVRRSAHPPRQPDRRVRAGQATAR